MLDRKESRIKAQTLPQAGIRKGNTAIDLQKVEVPTGDMFDTDKFNSMLGATKTLNDFFVREGMDDSQGRTPMDADYGQIKGIDPKNFKTPTDRPLTPAEQLMTQMNSNQNNSDYLKIHSNNPERKEVYKNNPLMELERQERRNKLQNWSDDRTEGIKRETALEFSPNALHNWDNDGIGGSKASAIKRQADRELLRQQNKDIAMMNPAKGPKAPINPETGKPFETMKGYKDRMEEWAMERAENSPYPGDIVNAKLEPGEYVLNRNAVKAIGEDKLNEINNKLKPRFSDRIRKKGRDMAHNFKVGANRKLWEEYLQKGGAVKHYALGDLVTAGKDLKEKFGASSKDFLNKAVSRYGGDAWKASKAMDIQRGATDHEGDPISIEQAKTMRDDYGLGKGNFSQAFGQAGQSLKEDIGTATSAGLGALKKTWDNRNEGEASDYADVWSGKEKGSLMQRGKKGLGMLGKMMQDASQAQGFKGADWGDFGLGKGGQSPKSYEEVRQEHQQTYDKEKLLEDIELEGDFDLTESNAEMEEMMLEQTSNLPPKVDTVTEVKQSNPNSNTINNPSQDGLEVLDDSTRDTLVNQGIISSENEVGTSEINYGFQPGQIKGKPLMYKQQGGPVTLEGFIQQSWRNMR